VSEHKNLYAALAAAQGEFEPLVKDATNPHFKSKYATLAAVMSVALPVLSRHGLCMLQRTVTAHDGKLYVETILGHESGETFESLTPVFLGQANMPQLGSGITYARRYGATAILGLAPEDDDDGVAAMHAAPSKAQPVPTFKAATAAHMKRELENLEHDLADTYTEVALESLWRSWAGKMNKEAWPTAEPDDETAYRNQVIFRFRDRKAEIQEKAEVAAEPPLRNPLMAGE
jgi:hypothetical protein